MLRIPRHVQARRILARAIRTGRLQPGSSLPRVASLCRELGVSPPTIHRSIQGLVDEGWLVRVEERIAIRRRAGAA